MLLAALPPGPFARLADLLGDTPPGKDPITLAVGDPSGAVPGFITETLAREAASFGNYPLMAGTPAWRTAAAGWIGRRFSIPDLDPEKDVLPLAGTREGLFLSLFPLMPKAKAGGQPAVAMPNPFYQAYAAAALSAGAEPIYVPATAETGFLPDYGSLPPQVLARLVAVYICSPSNPEGAVADAAYWDRLFALADQHDFVVLADECYADIYYGTPPVSALTARFAATGGLARLLSFHSLSKRSGLPGLRSGLVTGERALLARFRAFRNVAAPTVPGPLLAAAAAAWSDEDHVIANRAVYQEKMAAAERLLGNRMTRPEGAMFLWLDVGNGADFALKAWREQGVRILPGAYMGREIVTGKNQSNPGFSYVRVALVSDLSTIMTALERIGEIL
ncbi:MAG: aminotransferase class [Alphaproteobacteria bacterium]|nr:aminotransferase class [Alphaproteobacteria bacterium]